MVVGQGIIHGPPGLQLTIRAAPAEGPVFHPRHLELSLWSVAMRIAAWRTRLDAGDCGGKTNDPYTAGFEVSCRFSHVYPSMDSISLTSSAVSSISETVRSCFICSRLVVPVSGTMPACIAKRKMTCGVPTLSRLAIDSTRGCCST